MRMIGYIGGDSNTLAARRANDNDLRVAVEFTDDDRMLTFSVMQTGEIMMAWSAVHGGKPPLHVEVIGKVVQTEGDLEFIASPLDYIIDSSAEPPVRFNDAGLRIVTDTHDDGR